MSRSDFGGSFERHLGCGNHVSFDPAQHGIVRLDGFALAAFENFPDMRRQVDAIAADDG